MPRLKKSDACTNVKEMHQNAGFRIDGNNESDESSKMECFVIIVNGFQLLIIITKCSILDVAADLDPPASVNFIKIKLEMDESHT